MKPLKIFISYSHKDENYKDQLVVHLTSLKRRGIINEWHDRKLLPGQEWDGTIKQELIDSDIILLLISADFIASNYCYDVEINKALERHERDEAIVIPIVLRPCDWKDLPFSKLQALPKDAKPLSTWANLDEGFMNIISNIKTLTESKLKSSITENTNDNDEKSQTTDEEVIIAKLPRGYLVIKDIEFRDYPSWAVVASYYDYQGNWRHGTHYHESYRNSWERLNGMDGQCRKLGIPIGDWNYAEFALYLLMDVRDRKKDEKIEDILKNFQSNHEFYDYYKKGSKIPTPTVPEQFIELYNTGEVRDIIAELKIDAWKNYDLETLIGEFESKRRKAYLLLYEKLETNHPALSFVKEIIDDFKFDFNLEKLRDWSDRLSDALIDACKYLK